MTPDVFSKLLETPVNKLLVYHGGSYKSGNFQGDVIYVTPDPDMAASYVDMAMDRGFEGPQVSKYELTLRNAAPQDVVIDLASRCACYEEMYTPASCFDAELHGKESVGVLVHWLKQRGYDGAICEDIAYGKQIEGLVYIVFNPSSLTPVNDSENL